jgi:hypothetical protein
VSFIYILLSNASTSVFNSWTNESAFNSEAKSPICCVIVTPNFGLNTLSKHAVDKIFIN